MARSTIARIERLALIGAVAIVISTVAMRAAAARLAVQAERALYDLRTRAFEHIHRLSSAEHADERRGALVARVTSDVETLSQFFSWGGLAWLLDGHVHDRTCRGHARLRLAAGAGGVRDRGPAVLRAPSAEPARAAYGVVRERNADTLSAVSEMVMGAGDPPPTGPRTAPMIERAPPGRRRRHPGERGTIRCAVSLRRAVLRAPWPR